jgi:acyl-CoA dehydrogenase
LENLESFRAEIGKWLEENCPLSMRQPLGSEDDVNWGGRNKVYSNPEEKLWLDRMAARGFTAPTWPKEYGGGGLSKAQARVLAEELRRLHCRPALNSFGLTMLGPVLLQYGDDEQKREHLPKIVRGEIRWCQGYSEPGAGSDLASLSTRADDRGDHFVVNGQKVWTSGAQFADWIYLLVRTDPSAPKHRGISYLLVDMKTPGITVRPLVLLNGHRHFNEVFFVDVVVPRANLIGRQNEGWKPAMTTLMYERKGGGGRGHEEQLARLRALAMTVPLDGRPAWEHPVIRQRFAQLVIEAQCQRYTRMRNLTRQLRGEPPGPEGSILKLFGSELGVRIADFAGELLGPHALVNRASEQVPDGPRWYNRVLSARQYTIAGGTSEIQRNIIGERVLGLPKD